MRKSSSTHSRRQYGYNGFGQETIEYQEYSGSVNTSSSPNIQYAYADGSANTIRLTSQTFNNGRILDYGYNTGLDADISRVSYIADDGGTSAGVHLENYSYLGLDTVVKRGHPETGVDQTLIGSGTSDGGDQYVGLDRFGRVILQNWTNGTTSSDEYEYAYDRNGNALYQKNDLSSVNSELYHANASATGDNNSAYDTLNRLTGFRRGTLSSSAWNGSGLDTVSSLSTVFTNNQELWTLDALGNWSSQSIDGTSTSRTHNKRNQTSTVGSHTLTFDNNGNTTTDNVSQTYIYDAWNHIIQVKDSGGTAIVTYTYDANQRRITAVSPGTATRDLYYDTEWRIIEEYSNGTLNDQNIFTVNGYIDDVVLVDHDATTGGSYGKTSSGLDQRLYEMQDGQHRSTGLVNTSGSVVERFQYDPYGNLTDMNGSWGAATTGYAWEFLWKGMRLQTRDDIYYVRRRDYSPTLGRFLQEDPSGYSDGNNLYQAFLGNPCNRTDPLGLKSATFGNGSYGFGYSGEQWGVLSVWTKLKDGTSGRLTVQYANYDDSGAFPLGAAIVGFTYQSEQNLKDQSKDVYTWKEDVYATDAIPTFLTGEDRKDAVADEASGRRTMEANISAKIFGGWCSTNCKNVYTSITGAYMNAPGGNWWTTTIDNKFSISNKFYYLIKVHMYVHTRLLKNGAPAGPYISWDFSSSGVPWTYLEGSVSYD